MTARAVGPLNVYVPSPDATGQVISFSRDPKKFALPGYVQYVDVDKLTGIYTKLDPKQSVRRVNLQQNRWARGAVRPAHENNQPLFEYLTYRCERSDYGFTLPDEVGQQASWKVEANCAAMVMSQAMTDRTAEVYSTVTTTSNWDSGNYGAANTLNGGAGQWDQASNDEDSPYYLAIRKTLDYCIGVILKQTNGLVTLDDLRLTIGVKMAQAIGRTTEIRDMLKQSRFAMPHVEGFKGRNSIYNLPEDLYGLPLYVENATIVADNIGGANDSQAFVWDSDYVLLASQPGGLDGGPAAEGTFSTVTIYFYEQMGVETFADAQNRRTSGHVVDDRDVKMTASSTGFLITNAMSGVST